MARGQPSYEFLLRGGRGYWRRLAASSIWRPSCLDLIPQFT